MVAASPSIGAGPSTGPPLVLLAEDDSDTRQLYRYCFSSSGFEIEEAVDGLEAVNKARSLLPRAIVTDLCLPILDGFAVCREIRRDPRMGDVALIAVTGEAQSLQQAQEAGFDAYLVKPVLPDILVAEVAKWIHALRAARAEARELLGRSVTLHAEVAALMEESAQLRARAKVIVATSAWGRLKSCSLCGASPSADPDQALRDGWRPVILDSPQGLRRRIYCPQHGNEEIEADVGTVMMDRGRVRPKPDRRERRVWKDGRLIIE